MYTDFFLLLHSNVQKIKTLLFCFYLFLRRKKYNEVFLFSVFSPFCCISFHFRFILFRFFWTHHLPRCVCMCGQYGPDQCGTIFLALLFILFFFSKVGVHVFEARKNSVFCEAQKKRFGSSQYYRLSARSSTHICIEIVHLFVEMGKEQSMKNMCVYSWGGEGGQQYIILCIFSYVK